MSGYHLLGADFAISETPSQFTATPLKDVKSSPGDLLDPYGDQSPPKFTITDQKSQFTATPWKDVPPVGKKSEPSTLDLLKKFFDGMQQPGAPVPITPDPRTLAAIKAKQDAERERSTYINVALGIGTVAGLTGLFFLALKYVRKP